jgi:ABC-type sugar transport system ATPase subunit
MDETMEDVILSIQNVSKRFGGTQALKDVSFDIHRGEVHALMGENGAGKSTLVKIISSVIGKDTGKILLNGKDLTARSPQESRAMGISIVYQELSLSPFLTVAENISAASSSMDNFHLMQLNRLNKDAAELLEIEHINPRSFIDELGIGTQQIVEIAGAISRQCCLLIFDEPTSSLTNKETDDLFKIITMLKGRGMTIIYITHKINEVFQIADRITVLKDGEYVGTVNKTETSEPELINMMLGRDIKDMFPTRDGTNKECALEVQNLTGNGFSDVSFKLYKGEILGFAGLAGAGRTELFTAIFGANKVNSGKILVKGEEVKINNPQDAMKYKIGYLPEDRKQIGLFKEMDIVENTVAASIDDNSGKYFIDKNRMKKNTVDMAERMRTKFNGIEDKILRLSGGNQQKVLLARWLLVRPEVLIVDEPTRGIDIGSKQEVYQILRELANEGIAVVVISSELPEILGMSDRIVAMYRGKMTILLEGDRRTEKMLAPAIVGL